MWCRGSEQFSTVLRAMDIVQASKWTLQYLHRGTNITKVSGAVILNVKNVGKLVIL